MMKNDDFQSHVIDQLGRLDEKMTRVIQMSADHDKRLSSIEIWKANFQGQLGVFIAIVSFVGSSVWTYFQKKFFS